MLYQQFDRCIILDTIMRQRGESAATFRQFLNNLADGKVTEDQWKYLCSRELNILSPEERELFDNGLKLCSKNSMLKEHNIKHIKRLGTPVAAISSFNTGYGSMATSSLAGGLHKNTLLAKGQRVYLTSNEWKDAGLVNGARGTVVGIVYREGCQPPNLPDFTLVQFDNYIGPSCLEGMERIVPICPVTRNWISRKVPSTRTMIPLCPAYAMSIHKSQVTTL